MNFTKHHVTVSTIGCLMISALTALGQTQESTYVPELPPNQTIEREMTGAETHRYKITLKANEFFQVRIEQKGVDVAIKLTDVSGNVLASMDSPNEKEGPETLSFVATIAGNYSLEVSGLDPKAGKGGYNIRRDASRAATAQERQRVEADAIFAEARTLANEGSAEALRTAIQKFNEARSRYQGLEDKQGEANCLGWLGNMYSAIGEQQKALDFLNLALPLYKTVADRDGEVNTLTGIGFVYSYLGEQQKALDFYNLALPLRRATGDQRNEAILLNNIGLAYAELGERQKALKFYNLALPLRKAVGDRRGEAVTLNNIGLTYAKSGEKQKAVEFYNLALSLRKTVGDRYGEAVTLNNLGLVYAALGENQKALEFLNLALPLRRAVGDKAGEAVTLGNIGGVHNAFGDTQKALEFYNLALPLYKAIGDRDGEANSLNNIGSAHSTSGDQQTALEFFNRVLPLVRAVGDRGGEAVTLGNIGDAYYALGDKHKALQSYNFALSLFRYVGDKEGEAITLATLGDTWLSLKNSRLAIFYGKKAVNKYQELRQAIQELDKETQKTYIRKVEPSYRKLASVLTSENRLGEATQVINLLRDQEFFDFSRNATQPPKQAILTAHETALLPIFEVALEGVVSADQPLTTFRRTLGDRQPTPAETAELKRLEANYDKATANFQSMLKSIETDFKQPPSATDNVEVVPDTSDMQSALRELSAPTKQKAAALYTLIGEDKFHLILIKPDGELRSFESQIKATDLNKTILHFYAILQSPRYDPRSLGKELYDIIFRPVEAELRKAGVQTLMWQLDGNLRYVPMGALFDGEKYLVERFQNVVFTRADRERMTRAVSPNWTGTGFGSSLAQTIDLLGDGTKVTFIALPGVTAELATIFGTSQIDDRSNGIINGDIFIDGKFTKNAFYEALKKHRPLVHVSSHFAFRPGDDSRSFLLLGDGTALTLKELKKQTRLFEGVELLTLSACNTAATRSDANGREIDGFAELAQRLGAGAVMASLWSVADESTSLLMGRFYRLRKENPQLTKAAALQWAQRLMIEGKLQPSITVSKKRDTTDVAESETNAPRYAYDSKRPYAHPYYWSPFVLIGNWR